ncbi:unnamed protein product [Phaedon cochleariae]|uniref:Adenylate cyclase n=1 Tax=Phaedon cochleariae TaxID=80249 RepID=A0A9P0DDD7_PHACE|nr:unnamed protein product [Phaedon cochleariae]
MQGSETPTKNNELNARTASLKEKIINGTKLVTVEPLIAFYQMALTLTKPALDNLEFEKSCRGNLNFTDTICDSILKGHHNNYTNENNEIQVLISNMHSWQQPLQSFAPLLLILFLGSYSDRQKCRKPFFIIPIVGELLGTVGCMLCALNMKAWPLELQGFFQKVVPSLFGGQAMMVMATTAYIADISSTKTRTFRLGIVQIVISATVPLVNSFCGILFLEIGYVGVLSVSTAMLVSALVYGTFWIEEKVSKKAVRVCELSNVFDHRHAFDTFRIMFKGAAGVCQARLVVLVLVIFTHRCAFEGESNVLYLYVQNVFQWTPVDFSFFLTVNGIVLLIGNILGLPLFTRIFRMSDPMILLVCVVTKILTNVIFGLAKNPILFYVGSIMSIITRMYRVAKRSLSTKMVSTDDIGKCQSLFGIFEIIAPAVSVPAFNLLYIHTLEDFPAVIFLFSILLYAICCVLILWIYFKNKGTCEKNLEVPEINETIIVETTHM